MNVKCHTKHENRPSLYYSSSSHQKSVSVDDKSKHTRTNFLTLALCMSHSGGSFGYRCIAITAIHTCCVCFGESVLQISEERGGEVSTVRPPATKSPFLLMTNQNTTSPALHHQNQPPDSGSVHESQQQQLWLSLHRSHRHTYAACVFVRVFYNFRGREAAQLICLAAVRFS